ncbi:4Fe-4S single cluster domain-containing protein [Clostridium acidisoli DSM 12555]|uniref:4Fe-4S single cluster domain-containing protein n=1 Tax=Clostridium acidisoli DSM 12555 TaxID=1121291 RepID=A0A1W1XCM9_9CLOT|nr:radical SAM protein [Clostridium acidisoli]SMC21637.1 4Fe-4S single cluster domain-containing protein [Clostridium acidisoli DSM 12555]
MSKEYYIIPIFVPHEGCPHNCVFCNQNTITGSQNVVYSEFVRNTVEEYLETIANKNATIEVSFFGGTFTAIDMKKQKELLQVAKEYKNAGKIKNIRLSTRPDYINREILDNLKKFKVDVIELGVQSLDEDVLRMAGRGHSVASVYDASKLIREYGFTLGHQIMPGLPGDNFKRDIDTVKKVIDIKPDICRIYPSLVIKNTPMEEMYLRNEYIPYTLEEAVQICKELYGMFISNDIEVIRVGLQPTEEINIGREVVAGPFHPAFRELIMGSIYSDIIKENIIKDYKGSVNIEINSKDISKLYADKKRYFNEMLKTHKNLKFIIKQNDQIFRDYIVINLEEYEKTISVQNYLKEKYNRGNL